MKPFAMLGYLRSAGAATHSKRPARRAIGATFLLLALLLAGLVPGGEALAAAQCPNCFGSSEAWSNYAYSGNRGTFFADVDGDRAVDAIVVNDWGITVRPQQQLAGGIRSFGNPKDWSSYGFYGDRATFVADVNGDRKADLIAVYNNGPILVRLANSGIREFEGAKLWTSNPFYGDRATAFADVTGDGWADAIAVNYWGITVRRSMGGMFGINEGWSAGSFFGDRNTHFADVNGDGMADAIAENNSGIKVALANPHTAKFDQPTDWTLNPYYGNRATAFADVTGDGRADAIVSNDATIPFGRVVVRPSTGSSFDPTHQEWTNAPFYGTRGTFFVNATDGFGCWDGTADAITVDEGGIRVRPSLARNPSCLQ
jgi:hypothetical protein